MAEDELSQQIKINQNTANILEQYKVMATESATSNRIIQKEWEDEAAA